MSNNEDSPQRPAVCTDEMLEYLDDLRESGVTNMYGARPYVQDEFELDRRTAGDILTYWMRTFGNPTR